MCQKPHYQELLGKNQHRDPRRTLAPTTPRSTLCALLRQVYHRHSPSNRQLLTENAKQLHPPKDQRK
ncbi:hypothetical protein A2U01_0100643, partial [Trifolium medium]|nr:hypothetical protein [Trifolium medium]